MPHCAIIGERALQDLLVRYFGIGAQLNADETQILLFSLELESEERGGMAAKALKAADAIAASRTQDGRQRATKLADDIIIWHWLQQHAPATVEAWRENYERWKEREAGH